MAALAIFALALLVHDAAGRAPNRRLPLRHRLLCYSAACIVLGASALFHAVAATAAATATASAADPIPEASGILALAGFLLWAGGVALLLLAFTVQRFPVAARRAAQVVEALVASVF
jgi:hypothetical protein